MRSMSVHGLSIGTNSNNLEWPKRRNACTNLPKMASFRSSLCKIEWRQTHTVWAKRITRSLCTLAISLCRSCVNSQGSPLKLTVQSAPQPSIWRSINMHIIIIIIIIINSSSSSSSSSTSSSSNSSNVLCVLYLYFLQINRECHFNCWYSIVL